MQPDAGITLVESQDGVYHWQDKGDLAARRAAATEKLEVLPDLAPTLPAKSALTSPWTFFFFFSHGVLEGKSD